MNQDQKMLPVPIPNSSELMAKQVGRKRLDLAGQRIGRIQVLSFACKDKNGDILWKCHCDCGLDLNIRTQALCKPISQCWRCARSQNGTARRIDLMGKKFGKLTVVACLGKSKSGHMLWECKCDCGKIISTKSCSLLTKKRPQYRCPDCIKQSRIYSGQHDTLKRERRDLTNFRFGKLVVIRQVGISKNRDRVWECKCDCGTIIPFGTRSLKRQESPRQHCGCDFGYRLPLGEAAFNALYRCYKFSSCRRKLDFALSKEDFRTLVKGNCNYCGIEPKTVINHRNNGDFIYNGIDRKDNSQGYVDGNCASCCPTCNFMKNRLGIDVFLSQVEKIYKNRFETHAVIAEKELV